MPSIPITLTALSVGITTGYDVPAARWTAGFDHAALVTAYRSRADGYDLRMRHSTAGNVGIVSASGLNTSACKIVFIAAANVVAGNSDAGYSIIFGNLGATAPTWGAATLGSVAADVTVTPGAVPAVALPSPGFPASRSDDPDVDASTYPETRSPRVSLRNQNDRPQFTFNYPAGMSPEDWYEIRAFHRAKRGGAATWNPPAWMYGASIGVSATDWFRIVAVATAQSTRRKFTASVSVERVAA